MNEARYSSPDPLLPRARQGALRPERGTAKARYEGCTVCRGCTRPDPGLRLRSSQIKPGPGWIPPEGFYGTFFRPVGGRGPFPAPKRGKKAPWKGLQSRLFCYNYNLLFASMCQMEAPRRDGSGKE